MEVEKSRKNCTELRKVRSKLGVAIQKSHEYIYMYMNHIGSMGAQQGGNFWDDPNFFHGLHVDEMRIKFKEHILPILPLVKKVMVITGQGLHSHRNENKLKKVVFKLIGEHQERIYWQAINIIQCQFIFCGETRSTDVEEDFFQVCDHVYILVIKLINNKSSELVAHVHIVPVLSDITME